jgi:hypothetical protein
MYYDTLFPQTFQQLGLDVVYQPRCLQFPYDDVRGWPLRFPQVEWTDNTVVIMHCQDYVSIDSTGRCPEIQAIEQYFGKRANQVVIIHWNYDLKSVYSGPCHLVYFPTHSYEGLMRLQQLPYLNWQKKFCADRTRNWQCLNGKARPHRVYVHTLLKTFPGGISSLGNIDPLPYDAYHDSYQFQPGEHDLNESNFIRLSWLYSTTKINIVTETQYTETPGIITEKTLFALLAGQIPIVIGYPGIVEHCRSLGFDMFDDLVDNSYDTLHDDTIRWSEALSRNKDLLINTPDLKPYADRLQAQQEYVLTKWPQKLIADFKEQSAAVAYCLTNS